MAMPARTDPETAMNESQRRKALSFARPERAAGCADMEAQSVRGFAIVIAVEAAFESR